MVRRLANCPLRRVKQLEQRVDTLMGLLGNGQTSQSGQGVATSVGASVSPAIQVAHLPLATPPESAADFDGRSENTQPRCGTPAESPVSFSSRFRSRFCYISTALRLFRCQR
jgi:hypothetical protein